MAGFHSLCALCVYTGGPCCSPVCWLCSEASLPIGKAVGVATAPDPLGTNQTDTRCGLYLPACPGILLCTHTSVRPTSFSLASATGNPPIIHSHYSDNSNFSKTDAPPVQGAATLSGKFFQCLLFIKAWRSWKHWLQKTPLCGCEGDCPPMASCDSREMDGGALHSIFGKLSQTGQACFMRC